MTATQERTVLHLLRRVCVDVFGDNSLQGCCATIAIMVQRVAGGELLEGHVGEQPHYWNRLPDGTEVDLTSTQFGGDGWQPVTTGVAIEMPELIDPIHLMFAMDVLERLGADTHA